MENNNTSRFSYLLDDDSFIDWILNPGSGNSEYWDKLENNDTELAEYIQSIRIILKNVHLEKVKLSAEDKLSIWSFIEDSRNRKKQIPPKRYLIRLSAAAILLVLVGMFFIFRHISQKDNTDYQSIISAVHEAEDAENIALILDNEKQVEISGNNANVVYSNSGEIKVDSQSIENNKSKKASLNQLIVPYGKTTSLTLSDGSRIWVNSGSRLVYPSVFGGDKREVYIQGEAYIEVAKGVHPFFLKTENMNVRVLGTKFNVSAYKNDETQSVVLVSGSVQVDNNISGKSYGISPNQMYSFSTKTNESGIQAVDVSRYISWKSGFLIFRDEKLEAVLNKLKRYYNLSFVYDPQQIKDIKVGGKLNLKDNIEDVFRIISITTPIDYKIKDNTIEITASGTMRK